MTPDYVILNLELRLKELEGKMRKKDQLIRELLEIVRDYEAWHRSERLTDRPRVRRRVLPSNWRLVVIGPRYKKKPL